MCEKKKKTKGLQVIRKKKLGKIVISFCFKELFHQVSTWNVEIGISSADADAAFPTTTLLDLGFESAVIMF